jgi:hypothetical protein
MELDDILGETPDSTPVAAEGIETPEVETPEAAEGPARDEHGRFIPKGEETPATTPEAAPPAVQDVEHSPPPGLIEERRKRQEAEQRVQALAQQLQQFQAQQQPAQEPYFPSIYEDEPGYTAALQQQAALLAQQQMMPQVQQQVQQVRLEIAREMMGAAHPDFAETEAAFFQMAEQNPVLRQEMLRQSNPVRWAYDYAKKAAEVAKIGSLDIAAIKAAAIAEFQATQGVQQAAPQQQIPTSLADQQSARLTGGTAPTGPPTLDQILGR